MPEEKSLTVDVEQIMREIRADIKMQEDLKNLPDFESIPLQAQDALVVPVGYLDWALYRQSLEYINAHYEIPYYWTFTGNPVKVFLKRLIRKVLKCMLCPLLNLQNRFNAHVMRCLGQIQLYTEDVRDTTERLAKESAELRRQVAQLEEEVRRLSGPAASGQ